MNDLRQVKISTLINLSSDTRNIISNKRQSPEVYKQSDVDNIYNQLNEDYTNNGITPYTVQFLKRMADSNTSISYNT